MRFLRSLFRSSNPTKGWKEDRAVAVVIDLDRHRLSGFGIRDRLAGLSFLGPATADGSVLTFPSKGITVGFANGLITWFAAYVAASPEEGIERFCGVFQYRGRRIDLSEGTAERETVTIFGPPYRRDQDAEEVILFYEFGEHEWQIEMSLNDRLRGFVIAPPILADAKQRAAYGVTKPWPST